MRLRARVVKVVAPTRMDDGVEVVRPEAVPKCWGRSSQTLLGQFCVLGGNGDLHLPSAAASCELSVSCLLLALALCWSRRGNCDLLELASISHGQLY